MELVVNIDDNLYSRLFDNGVDNYDDTIDMAKAIRKGKPLPKGHGRLIDSNKLYDKYEENVADEWILDLIDSASTIIEADKENKDE